MEWNQIHVNQIGVWVPSVYTEPCGPGKFEGEPKWVKFLWDEFVLTGEVKPDPFGRYELEVCPGADKALPELTGVDVVILWEDDNGFVQHELVLTREY
jgi:hypothetical protein